MEYKGCGLGFGFYEITQKAADLFLGFMKKDKELLFSFGPHNEGRRAAIFALESKMKDKELSFWAWVP